MARPQKTATLTEAQIEQLAAVGCTDSEIATLAGLSESQLKDSFRPLLTKGRAVLRESLRTAQVRKALGHFQERTDKDGVSIVYQAAPDNTMLIWLGKQYLDQRDKQEIGGDAARPLVFSHNAAVAALARGSVADTDASGADESGSDGA